MEEDRKAGRLLMKRDQNNRAKNGSLQNTFTDSKGATFAILKNYLSALVRMERLSPTSKARREANRNKFMKKSGTPD